MECWNCQALLSELIDGTLAGDERASVEEHLARCAACAQVHDELSIIVLAARDCHAYPLVPPDERRIWMRIRNRLIAEQQQLENARTATATTPTSNRTGWLTRFLNKKWQLSLPQLSAAMAAIIVVVSLVTALSLNALQRVTVSRADSARSEAIGVRPVALDDYLRQQQLAIEYWQQRVNERRVRWNPKMREAFDRNMQVIDQAVQNSLRELERNPHDEVSEEMLNVALREKMELLREFSEL